MFYQLPPVGNPIRLCRDIQHEESGPLFGVDYLPFYYDSGTAALAAAIIAAIRIKKIEKPEVILPAYGCPDLVSAALFAGAKPVLVDFEKNRPWMDLEQITEKMSENTVAIIAVNLFGISERMAQLRPLANQVGALLIEDSAQSFPGELERNIWQGDLIVLSFGRGKPVSLLGGGAVLCNNKFIEGLSLADKLPDVVTHEKCSRLKKVTFWSKTLLYNGMISPRLYWLPLSLPFLHLGETHFNPLTSVMGIDEIRLSLLHDNVRAYQHRSMDVQNSLCDLLNENDLEGIGITDLAISCKKPESRRLLRYPLLVDEDIRSQLFAKLRHHGLGVSQMYPVILTEIKGLEELKQQGKFPEAASFARRLLTLPTHEMVSYKDIVRIRQVLMSLTVENKLS